jgi:ketosteroid isomerase-like protein
MGTKGAHRFGMAGLGYSCPSPDRHDSAKGRIAIGVSRWVSRLLLTLFTIFPNGVNQIGECVLSIQDREGAFAAFAKDILWHIPGRGPLSRDYRGHAEVQGFFQHFMELSSGSFRLQVDHILAEGDLVVVLVIS